MTIDLTQYGFTPRFQALAAQAPELVPARVVLQEKGLYKIIHSLGESPAALAGKLRYAAASAEELPAVGDFVLAEVTPDGNAVIHSILPRFSSFVRRSAGTAASAQVVAANIDRVFVCMALNSDFNLRRLERYLAIAWESGASPVVVLTKADLCEDTAQVLAQVRTAALGADIALVSSCTADRYRQVEEFIRPGQTIALIGSSGVGKSTMINHFLGADALRTNGLRGDGKGRHTTTHRELLRLENGGILIDTPGMRELGMWDSGEGIDRSFREIEALSRSCRFGNCTHTSEPGCAVLAAVEDGTLDPGRLQSYRKLTAENAYLEDSGRYLAEKKQKFRDISRQNKKARKERY